MATVSDTLPFSLQLNIPFHNQGTIELTEFVLSEKAVWEKNIVSAAVEENTEIYIDFVSADPHARFYLECFDIIPGAEGLKKDKDGYLYREASMGSLPLFKIGEKYDELCVDLFALKVWCEGKWYYGSLQILPKQMSMQEWNMMRDDLEREARGLAKSMMRKHIGTYSFDSEDDLELLRDFLILQRSAKKLNAVISDISDNPRYEVKTKYTYMKMEASERAILDAKSIREIMKIGGDERRIPVAEKYLDYDVQENRLLKMMVKTFEQRLRKFIGQVPESRVFTTGLGQRILSFREDARKLLKIFSSLKQKEWYETVNPVSSIVIPQAFLFDVRYSFIYQVYNRLHNEDEIIQEMLLSAKWKRSSYLYEMWCYFKLLHILSDRLGFSNADTNMLLLSQVGRLDLQKEAVAVMENDDIRIKVVYDMRLPATSYETDADNPVYIARMFNAAHNHNRPDIVIHAYDKKTDWYIGSLVFECKYRKVSSFLSDDPSKSSLAQLQMYSNNARSKLLYGGMAGNFKINPVRKVIALSPDSRARDVSDPDFDVCAQTLRPSKYEGMDEYIKKVVEGELNIMILNADMMRGMIGETNAENLSIMEHAVRLMNR